MRKRVFWLTLVLSTLLIVVAACGPKSPTSTFSAPPKVLPEESLYVLDGYTAVSGTQGSMHIVAFHPGSTTPTTLMTLPAGLLSQDHQRVYSATTRDGQTTITITNTQTGTTMRSFVIAGTYSMATQAYTTSVMSPDGKWLSLRQPGQSTDEGTIILVDTQKGTLVKTIHLDSTFYLDAISPTGNRLYLLQYLANQPGRYYVRAYDVAANKLEDYIIADKSEINDPRMIGSALTRQMAPDGSFAYTLYIDTTHNIAFVHILPLTWNSSSPYPPNIARCIDLPKGKSADLLRYYTLTLSAEGKTLYAANGALGVVSQISLTDDVFSGQLQSTTHFDPGNVTSGDKTQTLYKGAVLSADQKTLYFVGAHGIWAVNTPGLNVKKSYATQQAFTGIGLSADSQTLYAVHPTDGMTLINVGSGQSRQVTQSPAHAPWGIEWIAN